jgi:transposase
MSKQVKTKYTPEFRERAVKMVISSNKPTSVIAKDLGIKSTTLYSWVNKEKTGKSSSTEQTNEQLFDELKQLKKELKLVKEQRDILKKATAYFAKETQ